MIGRSGSNAFSWVAASQSLRIGRWRAWGAAVVDSMGPPGGRRLGQVCDGAAANGTVLMCGSDPRQHPLAEGAHLGEYGFLLRPLEIEIDRADAKVLEGMDVAYDIAVAAGKEPALAVGGTRRQHIA